MTESVPGFNIENDDAPPPSRPARVANHDDTNVILRGVRVPLASDIGNQFISDSSRNREKLLSDQRLIEKYGLSMDAWKEIAKNQAFRLAVDAEHERRVYSGIGAKEAAASFFIRGPTILNDIMNDKSSNARHKIEAIKELRQTASPGTEKSDTDVDRVRVVINLGADTKPFVYEGAVKPTPPKQAKEISDAETE